MGITSTEIITFEDVLSGMVDQKHFEKIILYIVIFFNVQYFSEFLRFKRRCENIMIVK